MGMRNPMGGGRCGEATAEGGEVAYLRHAEVGVEENPGTLRCALHTGLRKVPSLCDERVKTEG